MRLLTTILLLLSYSVSWGQGQKFTYGGNNAKVYVLGDILFPKYATSDSNKVIGLDSNGNLVIRTKGNGSGSGADSSLFTTIYRDDTGKRNIRQTHLGVSGGYYVANFPTNFNGYEVTGISNPVNETDAVPYGFFQQFMTGLAWKTLVLATTTEELPAFTFDGVDQIVFNDMGDCPVIDGVTLPLNARLLNKNSTGADTAYNGIFTVAQLGDEETQCVFQRSTDANTALLLNRATVAADSGVINRSKIFSQVNTITTINVTPVTFVPILDAVVNAGYGLTKVGNTLNVDTAFIMQVKDSTTGTSVLAKKYLTPYNLYERLNAGIELTNSQWSWIDGPGNQRIIVDNSGIVVQDAAGTTGTEVKTNKFSFNQPGGNGDLIPTTLTGSRTWTLPNLSGTVALTFQLDDTAAALRLALNSIPQIDTTSLSNRIDLRVKYTDTVGMSNRINLKVNYTDTVSLSNRINEKQNFSDTNTYDATRAWVLTQGYATNGSLLGVTIYSVAGTYTVTVPAGTTRIMYRAYGGGGGAAACLGNTSALSVSGGGCKGTKAEGYFDSWTTVVAVVGAGGSAGAISGCPGACAASNGGTGGTTTITNGTNTTTCPGGVGSLTYAPANANRAIKGGTATGVVATGANIVNGYSEFGHYGVQIANIVPNTMSGYGSAWAEIGQGGEGTTTSNTAGNSATGNASGGGGCISNTATGAANSKDGGAGAPGYVILFFYK